VPDRPVTSPRFDRVAAPDPTRHRHRDNQGKEALYSTAPTASPISQVEVRCRRCEVAFGLSVLEVLRLLRPPFLWDPVRGRLWVRCPVCSRRAWLELRVGQALRVLLDRTPGGA
jgi:hypothetical protein